VSLTTLHVNGRWGDKDRKNSCVPLAGHAVSSILIGAVAFVLKDQLASSVAPSLVGTPVKRRNDGRRQRGLPLASRSSLMGFGCNRQLTAYTDVPIGLSLVFIGALGIKEAVSLGSYQEGQSLSAAKAPKVSIGNGRLSPFLSGRLGALITVWSRASAGLPAVPPGCGKQPHDLPERTAAWVFVGRDTHAGPRPGLLFLGAGHDVPHRLWSVLSPCPGDCYIPCCL
jgi:hypothetical protein